MKVSSDIFVAHALADCADDFLLGVGEGAPERQVGLNTWFVE